MRVERILTFRYYCLDDDGRIIAGKFIEAVDLGAAIVQALAACSDHHLERATRIEIWAGTRQLYRGAGIDERSHRSLANGLPDAHDRAQTQRNVPARGEIMGGDRLARIVEPA